MDFTEVLDAKPDEIEKPPLPPKGEYTYKVSKPGTMRESQDKKWSFVSFPAQAIAAMESVDPDMLNDAGGLASANNRVEFMFATKPEDEEQALNNQRTADRLKRFLFEHLGMPETENIKQAIASAANHQFIGTMDYQKDKNDAENMFARITRTAPVE